MAVKKSELYSLLWEACNKLNGTYQNVGRSNDNIMSMSMVSYGKTKMAVS